MKCKKIYQPKVEMQKRKKKEKRNPPKNEKKKWEKEGERNNILSMRKLCIECESELHIYNKRLEIKRAKTKRKIKMVGKGWRMCKNKLDN